MFSGKRPAGWRAVSSAPTCGRRGLKPLTPMIKTGSTSSDDHRLYIKDGDTVLKDRKNTESFLSKKLKLTSGRLRDSLRS